MGMTISIVRRRLSISATALIIGLTALPAIAQSTAGDADSGKSIRQEVRQNRTATTTRPDLARPPRPDNPVVSTVNPPQPLPQDTEKPSRPATPSVATDIARPSRPETPAKETARPARADTGKDVRSEVARPDASGQPRTERTQRPRPESLGIARPDGRQASAPEPPDAGLPREVPRIDVTVLAIIATNTDNRVDPALRVLADQLRPTLRFSGYRLAQSGTQCVVPGQGATMRLIEPYSLRVTPMLVDANHVVMNVQAIQAGRPVLGLQLRLRPGIYQLLGGWPVAGNTLLAAVSARLVQ
jgi:hypothetical protein